MNFSRISSYTTRKLLSPRISHSIVYSSRNFYKSQLTFQRNATTTATTTIKTPSTYKLRNFILGTTSVIGTMFFIEYYFDSRAAIHKYLIMPLLRNVTTPESSHNFAIWISKWGLNAKDRLPDDERLSVEVNRYFRHFIALIRY